MRSQNEVCTTSYYINVKLYIIIAQEHYYWLLCISLSLRIPYPLSTRMLDARLLLFFGRRRLLVVLNHLLMECMPRLTPTMRTIRTTRVSVLVRNRGCCCCCCCYSRRRCRFRRRSRGGIIRKIHDHAVVIIVVVVVRTVPLYCGR